MLVIHSLTHHILCYLVKQVEDATKALGATNGTNLERNGQILRVAYAKSILGPGSGSAAHSQSSSLAAAAIEAATFAQQVENYSFEAGTVNEWASLLFATSNDSEKVLPMFNEASKPFKGKVK